MGRPGQIRWKEIIADQWIESVAEDNGGSRGE